MYNSTSSPTLTNCTFDGNLATNEDLADGGGMYNRYGSDPILTNCVFVGNLANWGSGISNSWDSSPKVANCTFTGNRSKSTGGGVIASWDGSPVLTNCILWDNALPQIAGDAVVTYCDIQGGWEGDGNINADPLFAEAGRWADVNDPNIAVEPNDPNAVWVDGDYHLKSPAGRWDLGSESWVIDDVTSPCIDAGDPNSPVGDEPEPNGGRINMGAYGGTAEASESPSGAEKVLYIQWLGHSSVKLWAEDCIVYVDPQRLSISPHDATLVCVTHTHSDHYSPADIARVSNDQTQFVGPPDVVQQYGSGQTIAPGQTIESYCARLTAIPAYNTNKPNHPKSNNWVGYIIELGGKRIYVAGDTDLIEEMKSLGDIDAAFLPVGGTYTMDAVEAAEATQYIKPDLAIPYHWGQIVGTLADAQTFAQLARCAVKIMAVGETIRSDEWPAYSPLFAYWKMDETEGNIADDSAGDFDGTLHGGPAWLPADGKVAGALQLDGVDDYVSTPFVSNPANGTFSVFAWVRGGAPGQVIISQADGAGAGEVWLGADAPAGGLMSGLVPPPAGRTATPALKSDFVITDGQWHHVGFVWDGSRRHLYADGVEVAEDTAAVAPPKSSDGGLYFGAGGTLDAGTFWLGLLDDIRIYNQALGAAEVEDLAR
jgi:L-ascorbate metabolism protein UlaG (beta-lactamase superfamily)